MFESYLLLYNVISGNQILFANELHILYENLINLKAFERSAKGVKYV